MLHYENLPYFSKEYDMWMLPKESVLNGQGLGSINECEIRAMLLIYVLESELPTHAKGDGMGFKG